MCLYFPSTISLFGGLHRSPGPDNPGQEHRFKPCFVCTEPYTYSRFSKSIIATKQVDSMDVNISILVFFDWTSQYGVTRTRNKEGLILKAQMLVLQTVWQETGVLWC